MIKNIQREIKNFNEEIITSLKKHKVLVNDKLVKTTVVEYYWKKNKKILKIEVPKILTHMNGHDLKSIYKKIFTGLIPDIKDMVEFLNEQQNIVIAKELIEIIDYITNPSKIEKNRHLENEPSQKTNEELYKDMIEILNSKLIQIQNDNQMDNEIRAFNLNENHELVTILINILKQIRLQQRINKRRCQERQKYKEQEQKREKPELSRAISNLEIRIEEVKKYLRDDLDIEFLKEKLEKNEV